MNGSPALKYLDTITDSAAQMRRIIDTSWIRVADAEWIRRTRGSI